MYRRYFSISMWCLFGGIVVYAYQYEWIIIRWSQSVPTASASTPVHKTRKVATLFCWNKNTWHKEAQEILWSDHQETAVFYLISHWLTLLNQDYQLTKPITLQSAVIGAQHHLYLSFDRTLFFDRELSVYDKWMILESLVKTLQENNSTVHDVYLLTHHHPMYDVHIDTSHPWPLTGYRVSLTGSSSCTP